MTQSLSQPKTQITTPTQKSLTDVSSVQTVEDLQALPQHVQTELEAAAFRRLVSHLQERTDVQNIDLMTLAGFCRNCLSKWYRKEAEERGIIVEDLVSREHIYGMPYGEWKTKYQK